VRINLLFGRLKEKAKKKTNRPKKTLLRLADAINNKQNKKSVQKMFRNCRGLLAVVSEPLDFTLLGAAPHNKKEYKNSVNQNWDDNLNAKKFFFARKIKCLFPK
jgi:hypothetical protein